MASDDELGRGVLCLILRSSGNDLSRKGLVGMIEAFVSQCTLRGQWVLDFEEVNVLIKVSIVDCATECRDDGVGLVVIGDISIGPGNEIAHDSDGTDIGVVLAGGAALPRGEDGALAESGRSVGHYGAAQLGIIFNSSAGQGETQGQS